MNPRTRRLRVPEPAPPGDSRRPMAMDDPVPSDSTLAVVAPDLCRYPPHQVESEVRRALLANPMCRFTSLTVRRVRDGVCLDGMLEVEDDALDVDALARTVAGVNRVINRLMIRGTAAPRKLR